jgi:hypothetical protein
MPAKMRCAMSAATTAATTSAASCLASFCSMPTSSPELAPSPILSAGCPSAAVADAAARLAAAARFTRLPPPQLAALRRLKAFLAGWPGTSACAAADASLPLPAPRPCLLWLWEVVLLGAAGPASPAAAAAAAAGRLPASPAAAEPSKAAEPAAAAAGAPGAPRCRLAGCCFALLVAVDGWLAAPAGLLPGWGSPAPACSSRCRRRGLCCDGPGAAVEVPAAADEELCWAKRRAIAAWQRAPTPSAQCMGAACFWSAHWTQPGCANMLQPNPHPYAFSRDAVYLVSISLPIAPF